MASRREQATTLGASRFPAVPRGGRSVVGMDCALVVRQARGALLGAAAVLGAGAAIASPPPSPAAAAAPNADLLPDLDQEVPSQLDVAVSRTPDGQRSYRLGFGSGVRNVGAGPLTIEGRRAAGAAGMVARQLVAQAGGAAQRAIGAAGTLRYVRSPDHQHWHLLAFDRYELRRAGGGRVLVRDRKSGFCLGDRYRVTTRPVAGAAPSAAYVSRCGLRRPGLRAVREGISVGYGDFYAAHLEFQDLPLDGLRAGRYVLVHRVNADRRLRELRYDNDAASVLLSLRWRNGVPHVGVLASCPDSARCDRPDGGAVTARTTTLPRVVTSAARPLLCALAGGR
jgi:Lysyl oxidase